MKIIVYPDASEGIEETLAGRRRESLEKLGELKIFYDAPLDHQEFLRRVDGANALLVGWALPVEVMVQTQTLKFFRLRASVPVILSTCQLLLPRVSPSVTARVMPTILLLNTP